MGNTISIEPKTKSLIGGLTSLTVTAIGYYLCSLPIICVGVVGGMISFGHYLYLKDNGERFGNKKLY
jgi:hypothetical protein